MLKQPIFSYQLLGDNFGALSLAQSGVGTCRQGSIGSHCSLALEFLGSEEHACGWAGHPPPSAGFQGPDWAGHWLCLSPRPCWPLRGSDLGLGSELGLSVYCPAMLLPQSSLNPMCTYPDVLLYILLFPCFRVARILKRFIT